MNDDGSVVLPNFNECVAAGGTYVESGLKRFYDEAGGTYIESESKRFYDKADSSVLGFFDTIKVLPLSSDPTSEDGDGDGILDVTEKGTTDGLDADTILNILNVFECDGVMFHQADSNIFRSDKKIYAAYTLACEKGIKMPDIGKGGESKKTADAETDSSIEYGYIGNDKQAFYIEAAVVRRGDIVVSNELRINANIFWPKSSLQLESEEVNIDSVLSHIKTKWEGEYNGSSYDFYNLPSLKVSLNFNKVDYFSDSKKSNDEGIIPKKRYINYVSDANMGDVEHRGSNINNIKEYTGEYASILFYDGLQTACNDAGYVSLAEKNGDAKTSNFTQGGKLVCSPLVHIYAQKNNKYNEKDYILGTCAHEFGHVIGLMDAYGNNDNEECYSMELIPFAENQEVWFEPNAGLNKEESGEMMHRHGKVSANDIEMVIFARFLDSPQFFVPKGHIEKIPMKLSPAIRNKYLYICVEKDNDLGTEARHIYKYFNLTDSYKEVMYAVGKGETYEIVVKDSSLESEYGKGYIEFCKSIIAENSKYYPSKTYFIK